MIDDRSTVGTLCTFYCRLWNVQYVKDYGRAGRAELYEYEYVHYRTYVHVPYGRSPRGTSPLEHT